MHKNYQKLILVLCIAPSSAGLYAMRSQVETKRQAASQAEVKTSEAEQVAGLQDPEAQVQVKLSWSEQVKIPVSAAALQQSAMLKATHEGDKDATEIPVTYNKCTQEQFERFCALLELMAQGKQQELRALMQRLSAADLLAIYHASCYYDVKVMREEIIKALPDSLTAFAQKDGIKAVQDLLAATEFLGTAAEKELKDGLISKHPWIYSACGKLQEVGGISGRRPVWSSTGDLAVIYNQDVLIYRNDPQMGTTTQSVILHHPANVQEAVWHPDGKRLVTLAEGSVYFLHHEGSAWQQQSIYTPQIGAAGQFNRAFSAHWLDAQSLILLIEAAPDEDNVQHWQLQENVLQHEHNSKIQYFFRELRSLDFLRLGASCVQWNAKICAFVGSKFMRHMPDRVVNIDSFYIYEYCNGAWRYESLTESKDRLDRVEWDQAGNRILKYAIADDNKLFMYERDQQGNWIEAKQTLPDLPGGNDLSDRLSLTWRPMSVDYNMVVSPDGSTLAIHKRVHYARDTSFTNIDPLSIKRFPWKSFVYLLRKQGNNAWRLVDMLEMVDNHSVWLQGGRSDGSIAWSPEGDRIALTSLHGDVHILGFGENITNISVRDLLLSMVVEQLKDSSAGASVLQRDKAVLEESAKKIPALKNALRIKPKWYTKDGIAQCAQKVQRWIKRNPKAALALCVAGGLLAYYAKKRLAPRVKKSIIMPLADRLKRKFKK